MNLSVFIKNSVVYGKQSYLFPCCITYILDYAFFTTGKVFSFTFQQVTVGTVISYISSALILVWYLNWLSTVKNCYDWATEAVWNDGVGGPHVSFLHEFIAVYDSILLWGSF